MSDDLDKRIINTLVAGEQLDPDTIEDELDSVVIDYLEDNDIIEGYVPKINYEKLGYELTAIIHLKIQHNNDKKITEQLDEQDQLISVYEVSGHSSDIVAIGKFTDIGELHSQIRTLEKLSSIRELNSNLCLSICCEYRQFPVHSNH